VPKVRTPAQAVKSKQRKFLLLIVDGMEPEEACRKIWPKVAPVEHIAKVMNEPKFKAAYSYLIEHRYSKEAILQKAVAVASDTEIKSSERVNALKLAAQLAGHITQLPVGPKGKAKSEGVDWKLVELARKAETDGYQKVS
jgi:hypothetical protein